MNKINIVMIQDLYLFPASIKIIWILNFYSEPKLIYIVRLVSCFYLQCHKIQWFHTTFTLCSSNKWCLRFEDEKNSFLHISYVQIILIFFNFSLLGWYFVMWVSDDFLFKNFLSQNVQPKFLAGRRSNRSFSSWNFRTWQYKLFFCLNLVPQDGHLFSESMTNWHLDKLTPRIKYNID